MWSSALVSSSVFFLYPSVLCFCSTQLPYLLICSLFSHFFSPLLSVPSFLLLHPSEKSHAFFLYATFGVLNNKLMNYPGPKKKPWRLFITPASTLVLISAQRQRFLQIFTWLWRDAEQGRRRTPIPCSTAPSSLHRGSSSFLSWEQEGPSPSSLSHASSHPATLPACPALLPACPALHNSDKILQHYCQIPGLISWELRRSGF